MPNGIDPAPSGLDALNYTVLIPYNGTIPTGGDSLQENLNIYYEVITFQRHLQSIVTDKNVYSLGIWHGSLLLLLSFY